MAEEKREASYDEVEIRPHHAPLGGVEESLVMREESSVADGEKDEEAVYHLFLGIAKYTSHVVQEAVFLNLHAHDAEVMEVKPVCGGAAMVNPVCGEVVELKTVVAVDSGGRDLESLVKNQTGNQSANLIQRSYLMNRSPTKNPMTMKMGLHPSSLVVVP